MIIEERKLEAINRTMVKESRYSPEDVVHVAKFHYGNSAIALSQICIILMKYVGKSAIVPNIDDLNESYLEYEEKGKNMYPENNVSAEVAKTDGMLSKILVRCDAQYLRTLRNIITLERSDDYVVVAPQDIGEVMLHLKDCVPRNMLTPVRNYLKDSGVTVAMLRATTVEAQFVEGKIGVKELSPNLVEIVCSPDLSPLVREVKGFKVLSKDGTFSVPKNMLRTLHAKFSGFSRESGVVLNLDDFENFIDLTIHKGKFEVELELLGVMVIMRIPYHPIINETLLNIPTAQFYEDFGAWGFHKRYLPVVTERLEATHLGVETSELSSMQEKIEFEHEFTAVDLFDYTKTPHMILPWDHQTIGAERILDQRKILLADEMGTGKTYTTILSFLSIGIKLGGPLVIVCPSSVKLNWLKEIRKIDKASAVCVVEGDYIFKANWMIINYDILDRHSEEIMSYGPKAVAYDESHKLKSVTEQGDPGSIRALHAILIAQFAEYVVSITGTPTPTGPIDLFNQFKLLDHEQSDDFITYGTYFCDGKVTKNGWNFKGESNTDELHEILKPVMIRNMKSTCLDLPDKIRTYMPVEVDLSEYNAAVDEYMNSKVFAGSVYGMVLVGQMKKFLAYAKIPRTIELVEQVLESGDSCVVFSDYTHVIQSINDAINKTFKGQFDVIDTSTTITGKDNASNKFNKVEDFQEGKYKLLVCNIKAGGVGLNMTQANKLIFNDLTWLPDDLFQAEDRIHRGGQTKKVEIVYLLASGASMDEKLGNVIDERARVSAEIIDGGINVSTQVSVMKGVMAYVEEVAGGKRVAGEFIVDRLEEEDFLSELSDDVIAQYSNDDFELELDDSVLQDVEPEVEEEEEPEPEYPKMVDGALHNPPYYLSIIGQEPLIYQYVKMFEDGYSLAIQLMFAPQGVQFVVFKRDDYSGTLTRMNYTKASQVNGAFKAVDEVGTHILQHLTKMNNYMSKGNRTSARATGIALQNTLKKYL